MMERIEELTLEGKNIVTLDVSGLSTTRELMKIAETFKAVIAKYPENSLFIWNVGTGITCLPSSYRCFLAVSRSFSVVIDSM